MDILQNNLFFLNSCCCCYFTFLFGWLRLASYGSGAKKFVYENVLSVLHNFVSAEQLTYIVLIIEMTSQS
jgi:hypothetical protein